MVDGFGEMAVVYPLPTSIHPFSSINLIVNLPLLDPPLVEAAVLISVSIILKKAKFKLTIALNFSAFTTYCSSSLMPALWQNTEAVSLAFVSQVMYAGCCLSLLHRRISLFSLTRVTDTITH